MLNFAVKNHEWSDTAMKKILIVEDDNHINEMIQTSLSKAGYCCVSAFSGTEARLILREQSFDLMILDLMLPGMTGEMLLKELRTDSAIPVIVLSAKDELDTKVDLLTLGADDYITKPFALKELEARVLVQLRNSKSRNGQPTYLRYQDLFLDSEKKQLFVSDIPVSLTAREYRIMELFLQYPQKVFTKNELYEYAWEDYYIGEDKTINVHISNIRGKMKKAAKREYIETVWGLGFRLI